MAKDFKVSCTKCSLDEICLPRGLSQQEVEDLSIEVKNILSVFLPSKLIGFESLFQNKYNCSAIALENLSYCVLLADKFDALCLKVSGIAWELLKHSGEAIMQSQGQIMVSKSSAEEKLAKFLINLSDRLHKRGYSAVEFNITLTWQEIGDHLDLTLETVSSTLK